MTAGSLLESIRCENGQLQLLPYHQERVSRSRRDLLGLKDSLSLKTLQVPEQARNGLFKCRVCYREKIESVEFLPYSPRPVHNLLLLNGDELDYAYKYANRSAIEALFARRGPADDVLFVRRGLLTDTSYANIALFDGYRWYTPAQPLLAGVRRAALLDQGCLDVANIRPAQLQDFHELRLINAMMPLEEGPRISINNIKLNQGQV